eukprot:CAMPEP_0119299482 /NCGR_PEP_ID=MMETSP1333-20130426/1566_1 /TAXON_ID=418940 /ORGANISM="Scyphosphaera apsteinii, Strain RCC1455" /LENGTH=39 /DNA_ID= /DNA_START= /DNA_END= /DNA_ORIENTATION=
MPGMCAVADLWCAVVACTRHSALSLQERSPLKGFPYLAN